MQCKNKRYTIIVFCSGQYEFVMYLTKSILKEAKGRGQYRFSMSTNLTLVDLKDPVCVI